MNAVAQIRQTFKPLFSPVMSALSGAGHNQYQTNKMWFRQILHSQRKGRTCLPHFLGLTPVDFHWISEGRSYRIYDELHHNQVADAKCLENDLRQQLLEIRQDEWQEIRDLLISHRAKYDDTEITMANIIAAACLGGGHLWRDLGLATRRELSDLLTSNYPSLVAINNQDMKWKKFFYKQLCELGGGYVCRAPSCDVCSSYNDCFGSED